MQAAPMDHFAMCPHTHEYLPMVVQISNSNLNMNSNVIKKTFWSSSSLFPVSLKQVMVSSERFNQLTKNHYLSNNPNQSNDDKPTNKQSSNDLKLSNVKLQLLEDHFVHYWSRVWSTSLEVSSPSRPRVQTTGSGTQNLGTPFWRPEIRNSFSQSVQTTEA